MATVVVCGSVNWDTTCFVDHLPAPGEEVVCDHVGEVSGGTGANTAVAAARILGPGQVTFLGALGNDRIAKKQIAILQSEEVSTDFIVRLRHHGSGHAYILVDRTGQNVIASDLGANAAMEERHVRASRLELLLSECRCVVLTDPPLGVAKTILRAAAAARIPALWDPGVIAQQGWDTLAPLTSSADSLVLNETEARQLFGTEAPDAILRRLDLRGAPVCIVLKRGSRGSTLLESTIGNIAYIPPLPMDELGLTVVNTVGCGDVFLGAYAAGLALRLERSEALAAASAAAGLNATSEQTRGGPTQEVLQETLRDARRLGFAITTADGSNL